MYKKIIYLQNALTMYSSRNNIKSSKQPINDIKKKQFTNFRSFYQDRFIKLIIFLQVETLQYTFSKVIVLKKTKGEVEFVTRVFPEV